MAKTKKGGLDQIGQTIRGLLRSVLGAQAQGRTLLVGGVKLDVADVAAQVVEQAHTQRKRQHLIDLGLQIVKDAKSRDMSIYDVGTQVLEQAYEQEDAYWWDLFYYDMVLDANGALWAIFSRDGRMYRGSVTIDGTSATLGLLEEVEVNYTPVTVDGEADETERELLRTRITRQADGKRRYTRVVSTAVLLRGSQPEIDSRELFDSFIENARETGVYPIASLLHLGVCARVGQADLLWRDDAVLWESGVFDDTPLAQRVADALEADEEGYWGTSIEYLPTDFPRKENIAGIDLTIWTRGIHTSSDWVPEHRAAAHFTMGTAATALKRGVDGMAFDKSTKSELAKLGLDDDLITAMEQRSSEINGEAASRITRAQTEGGETPTPDEEEGDEDEELEGDELEGDEDEELEDEDGEEEGDEDEEGIDIELTDDDIERLAEAVVAKFESHADFRKRIAAALAPAITETVVASDALKRAIGGAVSSLRTKVTSLEGKLAPLLKSDATRMRELAGSMPQAVVLRGTRRSAIVDEANDEYDFEDDEDEGEETAAIVGGHPTEAPVSALGQRIGQTRQRKTSTGAQ